MNPRANGGTVGAKYIIITFHIIMAFIKSNSEIKLILG